MKIAFDGRYAEKDLVGVGKYIKHLVEGLAKREIDCFVYYSSLPKTNLIAPRITTVVLPSTNRYYFEQFLLPLALKKESIDLYHATGNVGVPIFSTVPSILTIHDLIPIDVEDYFSLSDYPKLSKTSYILRAKTSCLKAKKIITITEFVKGEVIRKMKVKKEKIIVVNSGVSCIKGQTSLPFKLKRHRYVLDHGGLDKRKNLKRLLYAFKIVLKRFPAMKLVITGNNEAIKENLSKLVEYEKLYNSVIFTGYVDENTLWALIRSSSVICYPSIREGFGLPVLEGFCAGVPVIASKITSIPEIAEDAALLINPLRVSDISNALIKVLSDRAFAHDLVRKGKRVVRNYDWKKTIDKTLNVYRDALK